MKRDVMIRITVDGTEVEGGVFFRKREYSPDDMCVEITHPYVNLETVLSAGYYIPDLSENADSIKVAQMLLTILYRFGRHFAQNLHELKTSYAKVMAEGAPYEAEIEAINKERERLLGLVKNGAVSAKDNSWEWTDLRHKLIKLKQDLSVLDTMFLCHLWTEHYSFYFGRKNVLDILKGKLPILATDEGMGMKTEVSR